MSSNVSSQNPVEQVAEVELIAHTDQEVSLVAVENSQVVTTSLKIAEIFGKQHKDVLKAVKSLDCSEDFHKRNFALMQKSIKIGNGAERKSPMYYITRDGFVFLVMGFTGKTAAKWKEAYIKAFNDMEAKLRADRLGEEVQRAIEERDQKEYEEYLEQVRQEDEREYQHDKEVEEWHRQCEEAKAQAQAEEAKAQAKAQAQAEEAQAQAQAKARMQGGVIEVFNGVRVISSRTLAELQGRRHCSVMTSVKRAMKYVARPGLKFMRSEIWQEHSGCHNRFKFYYITESGFKMMRINTYSITDEVYEEVMAAFKASMRTKVEEMAKTPITPQIPNRTPKRKPTATPQRQAQKSQTPPTTAHVAKMPETPADLMQRFVKAMGVMMGVDTNDFMNSMNKGE